MSESQPTLLVVKETEDVFSGLESKVRRAVELVHDLRAEQAQLKFQLDTAINAKDEVSLVSAERDEARSEVSRLQAEVDRLAAENGGMVAEITRLKEEQREVKQRVQKVLSQLDVLGG
jgi:FtsZ-binding cell division protein ZapB